MIRDGRGQDAGARGVGGRFGNSTYAPRLRTALAIGSRLSLSPASQIRRNGYGVWAGEKRDSRGSSSWFWAEALRDSTHPAGLTLSPGARAGNRQRPAASIIPRACVGRRILPIRASGNTK